MLPEEQLFNISRNKQAGILFGNDGSSGLFFQQGNLGGGAFESEEDPLTSLLGKEFNDKYRGDYEDTLNNSWLGGSNRLTSQTGVRLLKDLNRMDSRGIAALRGLAQNPKKAIEWIRDINNGRVGIGGYTSEQAMADTDDIARKIEFAARVSKTGDTGLFDQMATDYVRGTLTPTIKGIRRSVRGIPDFAKPFVRDISGEFRESPYRHGAVNATTAKVQSTSTTGNIDEGKFSGKSDHKANGVAELVQSLGSGVGLAMSSIKEKFGPAAKYILPSLLLGALGGGINKARGGSFLAPLLLILLLGGMYGYGRSKNWFGSGDNKVNKTVDSVNNLISEYGTAGYNKLKDYGTMGYKKSRDFVEPYISKATEFITSKENPAEEVPGVKGSKSAGFVKLSNYKGLSVIDMLK